ncbi:hypothetical protein P8452_61478 [Trifolium repens]|nr:hypothetical protein P8452_61478 [Trifolium repens]
MIPVMLPAIIDADGIVKQRMMESIIPVISVNDGIGDGDDDLGDGDRRTRIRTRSCENSVSSCDRCQSM